MKYLLLSAFLVGCATTPYKNSAIRVYGDVVETGRTNDKCLPYYAKIEGSSHYEVRTTSKNDDMLGKSGYITITILESASNDCQIVSIQR